MQRKVYLDFQDGNGYRDISSLVKYDTLNITIRGCSDNFHYAQNECSFDIIYDSIIYPLLYAATIPTLCKIVDLYDESYQFITENDFYLLTEDDKYITTEIDGFLPLFYGRIPPTKSRNYNGILANTIWSIRAEDDMMQLDREVGDICYTNFAVMDPYNPSTSIVHQLAYKAGFSLSHVGAAYISNIIEKFAPDSENDSILDILDTLLFEYGYVLNFDANGRLTPIKWKHDTPATYNFTETNMLLSVDVEDSVDDYHGARLTWYELEQATTTNGNRNILLYRDNDCGYDGDGTLEGYYITAGYTYPPATNTTDIVTGSGTIVYQEYTDDAISYWTNYAIVNRMDYNYKAFSSDYSSIVATSGWYVDANYDTGIVKTIEQFGNKKARIEYSNPTGSALRIYYNNIYGNVWYKSAERTLTVDNTTASGQKLDEYVSTWIFDATTASGLVCTLAALHTVGSTYYKFISDENVSVGVLVNITMNDGTNQDCLVTEKNWEEKSGYYTYRCRAYTTNKGILTSQSYKQASKSGDNVSAADIRTISTSTAADVTATYTPHYYGKYLNTTPTGSFISDDTYCRYSTSPGTANRGVFKYTTSGWVRTEETKFVNQALTDISFLIAYTDASGNHIYGTAADYSGDSTVQANFAFFQSAMIGYLEASNVHITASGSLYGGDRFNAQGVVTSSGSDGWWLGTGSNTGMKMTGSGLELEFKNSSGDIVGKISKDNILFDTDDFNTSLGYYGIPYSATGDGNVAIGYTCMSGLTTGYSNVAMGRYSLSNITIGVCNVAIGDSSCRYTVAGGYNIGMGVSSLFHNISGDRNIGIGFDSLFYNTNGYDNIGVGTESLYFNKSGYNNTGIGANTLYTNSGGYYNTAIGYNSLYFNISGTHNTGVGGGALHNNATGSHNTGLGTASDVSTSNLSYATAIGSDAIVSNSSTIRCGRASTDTLRGCNYTADSDRRLKENITDIDLGLDFINELRPVFYKWKDRKFKDKYDEEGNLVHEGAKIEFHRKHAGFIAQEIGDVLKKRNIDFGLYQDAGKNNGITEELEVDMNNFEEPIDLKGYAPEQLIPILTKAIQELSAQNNVLLSRIEALENKEV